MKKILLIEDDYLDVENVTRVLKKLKVPHELQVLHNGADALRMLTDDKTSLPDIILLDINMPKMNGIEFLSIVRSYARLRNISIFILSTSADDYDRNATENLGISGYIIKPLKFSPESAGDTKKLLKEFGEGGS
jgi:CheY-like chemotaxis protein